MLQLRPYQEEDARILANLKIAGCFNEPRTGKTPTILKTLEKLHANKIIIICPTTAMLNWKREYERWLQKPCTVISGTKTQKEKQLKEWKHGLIINYDSLKTTKKSEGLIDQILYGQPDAVVIDEAHRIKNPKSANAKAVFKFKHILYRFALTGTPAPNKPEEIWSILHFLFPDKYTSYWKFVGEYFNQQQICMPGRPSFIKINGFKSKVKAYELQIKLNEISTNRKRKDIMQWLPRKDIDNVLLEPNKEQLKYLDELERFYETEHILTQGVLDRLIRYRQICLDPALLELPGKSPKTQWLENFLKDYPDEPVIIFSKFTSYIKLIAEKFNLKENIIVGDTTIKQRQERIDAFQAGKINQLLINIDAGKEAITLDRAHAIIFTDKYPPVGDIEQAEDRFIATVEEKANKPHIIYNLILEGTYDAQLYNLIQQRKSMIDIINDYKNYLKKRSDNNV